LYFSISSVLQIEMSSLSVAIGTSSCVSKWFCDTSTDAATGAAHCGSFSERALVSWSLAMDERGGHEDLCGSGRWSVLPYIHRRIELYCSSLPYLSLPICLPSVKRHLLEPFKAQGWAVTFRPGARQVTPRWLKPYIASRVIMARSSK
jgi:hypothetical protein